MSNGPEQPGGSWVPPASEGAATPPPAGGPVQQPKKTNGYSVASLVLGIIGLPILCPLLVPSVLALTFGLIARKQIERTGQGGEGMAVAGIVMGAIGIVCSIALIVVGIVYLANADWDDPDSDDVPNFIDEHDNDPNLNVIRPITMVAGRLICAVAM